VNPRLNRLFAADGRGFDVAADHGFFGEGSFLAGIEDMARTVATLVEAGPDAIQRSPSQASLLAKRSGPGQARARRAHGRRQPLRRRSAQPPLPP
jgi:fructose-bisphosphate aldolase, class I